MWNEEGELDMPSHTRARKISTISRRKKTQDKGRSPGYDWTRLRNASARKKAFPKYECEVCFSKEKIKQQVKGGKKEQGGT